MFSSRGVLLLRQSFTRTKSQRNISKTQKLPYTRDQQCQVLSLLNSGSQKELRKFIGAMTLRRLMDYRKVHGTFQSFENIVAIEGLGLHSLQNFCNKILMTNNKALAMASGIVPTMTTERLQEINTISSVNFDPPFMTFVKMDRDHNVLDWRRFMFMDDTAGKTRGNLHYFYNLAAACYPKLPQADIFIMEQQSERPGETFATDKKILQVALYTMLSFGEPEQPKVVQIKMNVFSKFYGLNMGSDRVSCQDIFQELIERRELTLPQHLKTHYENQNSVNREFFGLNALQCLAFLKVRSLHLDS